MTRRSMTSLLRCRCCCCCRSRLSVVGCSLLVARCRCRCRGLGTRSTSTPGECLVGHQGMSIATTATGLAQQSSEHSKTTAICTFGVKILATVSSCNWPNVHFVFCFHRVGVFGSSMNQAWQNFKQSNGKGRQLERKRELETTLSCLRFVLASSQLNSFFFWNLLAQPLARLV